LLGTALPMSFYIHSLKSRLAATDLIAGHGVLPIALIAALHLAAIALMGWYEFDIVPKAAFVLTWGLLNFFWLAVLRRPGISAALSLVMIAILILLSELKHQILFLTLNFVDLMIIDTDSIAFLFTIFPNLASTVGMVAAVTVPILALVWWLDPFRVRLRSALAGTSACLMGLTGLSFATALEPFEAFYGNNHVSNFARSGVAAISELFTHGLMESDAVVTDRLKSTVDVACAPASKPPHIIMVHDESSFDIRSAPGIKVPPDYGPHFKSFDGRERNFLVEGVGGPSWYAEYNVLTGLSARSFGRFSYFVTRIAAGRVVRGLPNSLRRCGYRTFSLYPSFGAFMSARSFQTTTGVQKFVDATDMGAKGLQPDKFYYDAAARMVDGEHRKGPMFLFVYLAANHFPWDYRFRPDLMPQWRDLENKPEVNEYLRRQSMSAQDYAAFVASLKQNYPDESFLLVRYGDHQPEFAANVMDPSLGEAGIAQRLMNYDPKYYTTYYAIDAINFTPADMSSAIDTLDGPYLPLVVQEAAGLPLDPSFVEQKKIFKRCGGIFYACNGGAEARHFNRLLIDAGLIKQL
jgi:hypothetical protein